MTIERSGLSYILLQFSALHSALSQNLNLQLTLQLDERRTTRPGKGSPVLPLISLLRSFPDRVQIGLYRAPTLKGILRIIVPRRFNEGWGTWHVKCYGADNDVILSG